LCIALAALFDAALTALGARSDVLRAAGRGVLIVLIVVAGIRARNRNPVFSTNAELYDSMPRTAPESARGYFQRAEYERSRLPRSERRLGAAIADYKKSIEIWPEFLYAYLQLAIATAENGDIKSGLQQLDALKASLGEGEGPTFMRTMIELKKQQIVGLNPRGDARTRDEIQKLLEDQIRTAPEDIGPYLALIPIYLDQGELAKAKDLLANSELKAKDPLRHLAIELQMAGREMKFDEVRRLLAELKKELETQPVPDTGDVRGLVTLFSARMNLLDGLIAQKNGDMLLAKTLFEDGLKGLNQYIENNENDWQGYFDRGEQQFALENFEAALADYQEALKRNPAEIIYKRIHGVITQLRLFDPKTLQFSEEAEKMMPKDVPLKMQRALFLSAIGRHSEAAQKVLEAINLGQVDPNTHVMYANELTMAGKPLDALAHLAKVMETAQHPQLLDAVGTVLLETNDPKGALEKYQEARAMADASPAWQGFVNDFDFHIAKTQILIPGMEATGVATLQRIADTQPPAGLPLVLQRPADQRRAYAMRQLARARMTVESMKDPPAAVKLLEKSIELARAAKIDKPSLRDLLVDYADALAASGRMDDAKKALGDAEKAAGTTAEIESRRAQWK
jgi:tetratricopeptide (TPR) repeat protein